MTERFEYKHHKVFDNLTGEIHSSNMVSVNVLNALHEENQELKARKYPIPIEEMDKYLNYGDIKDLQYANEVIESQRKEIRKLHEENQRLLSANIKLTEENTNLLSTIRTAYQNERTNIGRMVLKQVMEQFE